MTLEERVEEHLARRDYPAAATAAVQELGPKVAGYFLTLFRDEDDAADAFSQWTEALWKGIESFRGRSSFRTWAFRLAWNSAVDLQRRAGRRRVRRLLTAEMSNLAGEICTRSFVRYERDRQRLQALREQLSPDEQTLLFLRLDQELSWSEVAEVLSSRGAPVDSEAAAKRFERIKARLRKAAQDSGALK